MSYRLRIWLYYMLLRMSSVKIKKNKVFFAAPIMSDSEKSRFPKYAILGRVRILCAIYSLQFISIHFISFLFYSAWRKKRNVTNDNENNENNEILRKKGKLRNITKKKKYFKKKITFSWYFMLKLYTFSYILRMSLLHFLFFLLFRYFRFYSLFVNYDFI